MMEPLMKCICTGEGSGCTNKCDRGQLPPIPPATFKISQGKVYQVPYFPKESK